MRYYTDDPARDFTRQDMEQARYEARLPKCEHCGKTLWEHCFEINNEILCEECTIEQYRKDSEDFAEID